MSHQFDFISATDKPALLAITSPEWLAAAETALNALDYKVHKINHHLEFAGRYSQVAYQLAVVEEKFGSASAAENLTLSQLQSMPMNQRRHTTIILVGDSFETLNALQAFQQSVHAVIHISEIALLAQIVQKVVTDNDAFLKNFREAELRVAHAAE
ncbi:MAG: hypothetical protein ABI042_15225 [Verrucomicrobiota bacterium]